MLSFPFLFKIFPCCIIFTLRCSFCIICMEFLYIILPFMSLNSRLCSLSASNLIVFWGFCVVHFFFTHFLLPVESHVFILIAILATKTEVTVCVLRKQSVFVMVFTSCSTTNFDSRESLYSTCRVLSLITISDWQIAETSVHGLGILFEIYLQISYVQGRKVSNLSGCCDLAINMQRNFLQPKRESVS